MTNSDEAIAAVLNKDDAIDKTLTHSETANQYSASTQTTKSIKFNPNYDSVRDLNVDNDVVMKVYPEEITDISVAGYILRDHISNIMFARMSGL